MRHVGLVLALLVLPALAAAQSPCETPLTGEVVVNPTKVAAQLPQFDLLGFDSAPAVPTYRLEIWAEGASAPQQTTDVPRAAWTLVPGSAPACYVAQLPNAPISPWVRYVATLVAVGANGDVSPASNRTDPFGLATRPVMVPALRVVR